jgi:poly-gamma-glutamate synthesis protein (capsule biosynthesis protein)
VTALTRGTTVALESNGIEWAAEVIAPLTTRVDLFHLSSESSAIDGCPTVDAPRLGGNSSFCTKPEHLRLFSLLGADVIELSGNHNNDYGYDAYLDTLKQLRADGFATVGGGETIAVARAPFIWEGAGGRVAWLACNAVGPYYALADEAASRPGAASCDANWLRVELPRLKAEYDVVILTVQYVEFDQHNPTENQRRDFATYAGWGADYVAGTQAHFPQSLNIIAGYGGEDAFVHYGLGNFIFDQPFWAGMRFLLDELYIYDGRLHTVAVYPGIIEGQGRPRLMTPDERANFWYVLFNQHGEF